MEGLQNSSSVDKFTWLWGAHFKYPIPEFVLHANMKSVHLHLHITHLFWRIRLVHEDLVIGRCSWLIIHYPPCSHWKLLRSLPCLQYKLIFNEVMAHIMPIKTCILKSNIDIYIFTYLNCHPYYLNQVESLVTCTWLLTEEFVTLEDFKWLTPYAPLIQKFNGNYWWFTILRKLKMRLWHT